MTISPAWLTQWPHWLPQPLLAAWFNPMSCPLLPGLLTVTKQKGLTLFLPNCHLHFSPVPQHSSTPLHSRYSTPPRSSQTGTPARSLLSPKPKQHLQSPSSLRGNSLPVPGIIHVMSKGSPIYTRILSNTHMTTFFTKSKAFYRDWLAV